MTQSLKPLEKIDCHTEEHNRDGRRVEGAGEANRLVNKGLERTVFPASYLLI